jgi:hypothetical protein
MKHTPYGQCTFSAGLTISKIIKQGILTKNQGPLPYCKDLQFYIPIGFIIVSLYFCNELSMFMTNKFQMPSSNSSLVITFKSKATKNVCTEITLRSYALQKFYINKSCTCFQNILHLSYQDLK